MSLSLPLELGECVGRGGEARVFALKGDPSTIAKLYHHPAADRAEKLAAMIAHPPAQLTVHGQTVIAWPTDRIFTRPGGTDIAGFLMPRVAAGVPAAYLHNTRSRLTTYPHFSWKYLVRAAMNLSLAVDNVHASGYVIGDVNDQGVLVADNAIVALVDCDSFQVTDPATARVFRCTVGTGLFTPPELAGRSFASVDRTEAHDRFGLAVLIYQFLMGCHPFQIKAPGAQDVCTIEDAIARGLYPDLAGGVRPSPVSPPLEVLPPATRALFRAAFGPVVAHRPPASVWAENLWSIDAAQRNCLKNPNHWFSSHLPACPWCERADALRGRDPFPSPDTIRRGEHVKPLPTAPRRWAARPRPRGALVNTPQARRANYVARLRFNRTRG